MLGAKTMWGLMSPVSKIIMAGGAVTPLVISDLRIGGAMVLFWVVSVYLVTVSRSRADIENCGNTGRG